MRKNQKEKIIDYINQFGAITSMEAFSELGITQLGARMVAVEENAITLVTDTHKLKINDKEW